MSKDVQNDFPQYLSFRLDKELYAINIAKVKEVLDLTKITKVPRTPEFMLGVINLRGSVVPVVDMKMKFDMGQVEHTRDTCIIIVEVKLDGESITLGLLADSVNEVMELLKEQIEAAPKMGTRINNDFINGMGKSDEDFIILLDIDKIFSVDDIINIQQSEEKPKSKKVNKKEPKKELEAQEA